MNNQIEDLTNTFSVPVSENKVMDQQYVEFKFEYEKEII